MGCLSCGNAIVVGTGVIGRSWIRVFTRAGFLIRVFDPDADQLEGALAWTRNGQVGTIGLSWMISAEPWWVSCPI